MEKKLICPECGHNKFMCKATIDATLVVCSDGDGEMDYELQEWDYVESIQYFLCQECDFEFEGDEDAFREYLESAHSDTIE
jgi:transcription elongation factor Elf1